MSTHKGLNKGGVACVSVGATDGGVASVLVVSEKEVRSLCLSSQRRRRVLCAYQSQ